MAYRSIIYFKIKDFFAEVEKQRRADLHGRPIVVGKAVGNTCIVVSASAEARKAGVSEGITIRHAQRLCPEAAIVSANLAVYREIFDQILWILSKYSPLLEPRGSDSAFLDVTAVRRLFGAPEAIAAEAARRIKGETGMSVSAGIAANKLVAESVIQHSTLNSQLIIVPPGDEQKFLSSLPVKRLRGVGDKTAARLGDLGVRTIGQLAQVPERLLVKQFGAIGRTLYLHARGIDHSRVEAAFPPEVVVIEHAFPNEVEEPADMEASLAIMADKLSRHLKENCRTARTVALTLIRYFDHQPSTINYQLSTKRPISSQSDIFTYASRLLHRLIQRSTLNTQHLTPSVTGMSLKLSDLRIPDGLQLGFLDTPERDRRLDLALETIRARFGVNAIRLAGALRPEGRQAVLARLAA